NIIQAGLTKSMEDALLTNESKEYKDALADYVQLLFIKEFKKEAKENKEEKEKLRDVYIRVLRSLLETFRTHPQLTELKDPSVIFSQQNRHDLIQLIIENLFHGKCEEKHVL